MPITHISLENFTVFKNLEIDFSEGVNIIIGENGVGKTHLLKVLYAFPTLPNSLWKDAADFEPFFLNSNLKMYDAEKDSRCNVKATQSSKPVFIPAKEMLSHSKGLLSMADKYSKDMPFDKTLLDIIRKAEGWKVDNPPQLAIKILPELEQILEGKVVFENNSFFIIKNNGLKVEFSMEAEGLRKFGLLWQLLMNESITKGTVLLWDEPEANINPKLMPLLVEIILELQRSGVQIFITTHDYLTAKYFEVRRKIDDKVMFYSLFKTENGVKCETNINFKNLINNPIMTAFNLLLDEIYEQKIGD